MYFNKAFHVFSYLILYDRNSILRTTRFFISITFISNAKLKLVKNQAKANQHPEAELSLPEKYNTLFFLLPFKDNRRYSWKLDLIYTT